MKMVGRSIGIMVALYVATVLASPFAAPDVTFTVDTAARPTAFPHYWEVHDAFHSVS
jgi:hypothetical protein